eukprot:gene2156-4844_t
MSAAPTTAPTTIASVSGWLAFALVVAPAAAAAAACLVAFSVLRRRFDVLYQPRGRLFAVDTPPPPIGDGLCAWLPRVLRLSDDDVVATAGLDAFVLHHYLRLALSLFAVLMGGSVVCLAVYYVEGEDQADKTAFTLGNLPVGSDALWAPLVMCWASSIAAYVFLERAVVHHDAVAEVHLKVKAAAEPRPEQYSVVVRAVPPAERSDGAVRAFFESFSPGEVHCVTVAREVADLAKLVEERREALRGIEKSEAVFREKGERPRHRPLTIGPGVPEKVDSIGWWTQEAARLTEEVAAERGKEHEPLEVAFVSFKTPLAAAKIVRLWNDLQGWVVSAAPAPSDVHWANLSVGTEQRKKKALVGEAVVTALVFLWSVPIAAISAVTTLENLQRYVPGVDAIVDQSEALAAFLQGFLPTVAVIVFMALLPTILTFLAVKEGIQSWSQVDMVLLRRLFYFQLVNVFFVMVLAGALFSSMDQIVHKPMTTHELLGAAIPKVSSFFINFILVRALVGFPIMALRVDALVLSRGGAHI